MMEVLTDDFNLSTLKIVAVAEFCGSSVRLEKVAAAGKSGKPSRLPVLRTENGFEYFSPNASCRYLYTESKKVVDSVSDAWLEWEATVLQPHVCNFLESPKGPNSAEDLQCNLNYLNHLLAGSTYVCSKDECGLSDIVLWTTLYPLFEIYGFKEDFEHVRRWFAGLKEQKPLKQAVNIVLGDKKTDFLKKALMYHPVPVPVPLRKYLTPVVLPGFSMETSCPSRTAAASSSSVTATKQEEEGREYVFSEEELSTAVDSWSKGVGHLPTLKHTESIKIPKQGEQNILITSALPYVNNVPHLGNIIGAVLSADVFARYCRLRNFNTLYICGTDEYGTATETKAIELGVTPKEICDMYNKLHKEIYEWFNISFDYFGRTTTTQQTVIAQDIFRKLHKNGLLIEDTVEQLYCGSCQRFLADRFVEGTCPFCLYEEARGDQCDKCDKLINAPELKNPACKVCKSTPHLKTSKHLFLDLPKLEPDLKEYREKSIQNGHWSNTARVITSSWLKEGLKPRCITRDLKWGTPVPLEGFTDKVFYVWFDAPIGYLSITANYTDNWESWWKHPEMVQLYQFMAKDNVPFHGIIFPACQLGTKDNYTMVNSLVATEYLNYEDMKFSKSRGIGVFGDDARDTGIPSDIWRFYLLYLRPESQDSYFSWNDLMTKNNSELLNNLGNFINRALMFISNNFGGVIPEMQLKEDDKQILAQVAHELNAYIAHMEKTKLREAIRPMLSISRMGNQYIQSHKPWELIKGSDEDRLVAGTVLGISANIACLLCTLMEPYMPQTSAELRTQLNTKPEHHVLIPEFVCILAPGHKLGKPTPLFKKLEQDFINKLKVKYAGRQTPERTVTSDKKTQAVKNEQVNGLDEAEIERMNNAVTEQGNKVRELKTSKAEKAIIDKEVAVLLDLKKQLAILKGENPVQAKSKGKSKSKK